MLLLRFADIYANLFMIKSSITRGEDSGMAQQRKNDFSQGGIARNILSLAIPLTVAQLTVVLYNVVDRAFIGHIDAVGRDAFTGIGLVMPCTYIITAFANLCGTGGAPLFSIARGRGDDKQASRIMGVSFTLLLLLGAFLTVGFYLFETPFLYLVGGSDETVVHARNYLQVYLVGVIPVMIGLGMNPFINAQGFGKVGMMTTLLGAVINLILDPVLIFGLDMGVRGAALATVIAQTCSAVWVLVFLTGRKAVLRLERSGLGLDFPILKRICGLGLTAASLRRAVRQRGPVRGGHDGHCLRPGDRLPAHPGPDPGGPACHRIQLWGGQVQPGPGEHPVSHHKLSGV